MKLNPQSLPGELIAAATEAVTAVMSDLDGAPRPLRWSLVGPQITGQASRGDYDEAEIPDLLRAWADFLGLAPDAAAMPGSLTYTGTLPGNYTVDVWGIVDSAAWDGYPDRGRIVDALAGVPQITTDDDGVHRDQDGQLYDAVETDGELTFVPQQANS